VSLSLPLNINDKVEQERRFTNPIP